MENPEAIADLCEEYRGYGSLVLAWVLGSTAIILVTLRAFDRIHFGKGLAWDDYTMIAAVFFGTLDNIAFTLFFQSGLGRHINCLTPENISNLLKWLTMADLVEVVALGLAKVSVCLFIQRVLGKTTFRFSFLPRILMVTVIVFHTADFFVYALQCRPIQAIWDPLVTGSCYSFQTSNTATYVVVALDAFTDLLCAGLPIFVISRLQMNNKAKLAICILMGLGVFTACCAVGKAVTFRDFYLKDSSWAITTPSLWAVAETQLSMNLPSVPVLRSLYLHLQKPVSTDPESLKLQPTSSPRLLNNTSYGFGNRSGSDAGNTLTSGTSGKSERHIESHYNFTEEDRIH